MQTNIHPIIIVVLALFLGSCKRQAPDDEVVPVLEEIKEEAHFFELVPKEVPSEEEVDALFGPLQKGEPSEEEVDALIQRIIKARHVEQLIKVLLPGGHRSKLAKIKDKENRTLLHYVVNWGERAHKLVKLLLEQGSDPLAPDFQRRTPLHYAAGPRDKTSFLMLVTAIREASLPSAVADSIGLPATESNPYKDINLGPLDENNLTPFELASYAGAEEILKFYIDNVPPDNYMGSKDKKDFFASHAAAMARRLGVLRLLYEKNLLNLEKNNRGHTPLDYALNESMGKINPEVVNFLTEALNQAEFVDSLVDAAKNKPKDEIKRLLESKIVDKSLLEVVANGPTDAVEWLREEIYSNDGEGKIDARKVQIACNLINTCKVEGEAAIKSLLEQLKTRGLNLAQPPTDNSGSVLDHAFRLCIEQKLKKEAAFFLKQICTEPYDLDFIYNYEDEEGLTFLHHIVSLGYQSVLQILSEKGLIPIINKKSYEGITPLFVASIDQPSMVSSLIKQGARMYFEDDSDENRSVVNFIVQHSDTPLNLCMPSPSGYAPIHYLCAYDLEDGRRSFGLRVMNLSSEFLLDCLESFRGCNGYESMLESRGRYGETPIWVAAAYVIPDMVDELLDAGANPNVTNYFGETPLHVALERYYSYRQANRGKPKPYYNDKLFKQTILSLRERRKKESTTSSSYPPRVRIKISGGSFGDGWKKETYSSTSCFSTFQITQGSNKINTIDRYPYVGEHSFKPDICIKTVEGEALNFSWGQHQIRFSPSYNFKQSLDSYVTWQVEYTSETPPAIKKYFEDYANDIVDRVNPDNGAIELIITLSPK